jgi:hypothetical protein
LAGSLSDLGRREAAAIEKLCPDCGSAMTKNGLGAWKCPNGCGEWLRNDVEETEVLELPEKIFQPLTEGLSAMRWRTPEKPVLSPGPPKKQNSKAKHRSKKKKIHKPLATERYLLS